MNFNNDILDESKHVSPAVLKIFDGYKYSNPKEETSYNIYNSKNDVIAEIKTLDSKVDNCLKSILSTKNNIAVLEKKLNSLNRNSGSHCQIRKTEKDIYKQEEKLKNRSEQYEINDNKRQYLFNKISIENICLYKGYCEAADKVLKSIYNTYSEIDKLKQKLQSHFILLFFSTLPNCSIKMLGSDISALNTEIFNKNSQIALYRNKYDRIVANRNNFLDTLIE